MGVLVETTYDTTGTPRSSSCHIVQIIEDVDGQRSALSDTLRAGLLRALESLRLTPLCKIDHIRSIMKQHQVDRLAVVWNIPQDDMDHPKQDGTRDPIQIPEPLTVRFQPIPIDDSSEILEWLRPKPRSSDESVRGFTWRNLKYLPLTILFVPFIVMVAVLIIGPHWVFRLFFRRDWFIMPGCAILRQATPLWSRQCHVRVLTPADTLVVAFLWQSGWQIYFHHKRWRWRCGVSDESFSAFLAAWRSPLAPPQAADLADFV